MVEVAKEKIGVFLKNRQYAEAEVLATQVLKIKDDFKVRQLLVIIKMYLDKMPEAREICLLNIKSKGLAEDYNNLSLIERSSRNFDIAYKAGKKSCRLKPDSASIVANFAITAMVCNKSKEAFDAIEKAISLDNSCPMFHANKASMLCDCKRYEEAESVFEECISLNPMEHQIFMDYFYCLANQKKYKQAWPYYESRYSKIKELQQSINRLNRPVMFFKKSFYEEKICVIPEQGIGDEMMFLRFLPEFQKIAPNSYFLCKSNMYEFAKHLPIKISTTFDEQSTHLMGIMSLPFHLGISNIPNPVTPVYHSPCKSEKLRVGICWAGSPFHPMDWARSTYLRWWEPFLIDNSIEIYSFMKDKRERVYANTKEKIDYCEGFNDYSMIDLSENMNTVYSTALELNKIDVFVTVDSFMAHMAATCNVPTHVLVAEKHDWRWGPTQIKSDWYPSITIHRLDKKDNFQNLIKTVHKIVKDGKNPVL